VVAAVLVDLELDAIANANANANAPVNDRVSVHVLVNPDADG
jgi:hypothetical protein